MGFRFWQPSKFVFFRKYYYVCCFNYLNSKSTSYRSHSRAPFLSIHPKSQQLLRALVRASGMVIGHAFVMFHEAINLLHSCWVGSQLESTRVGDTLNKTTFLQIWNSLFQQSTSTGTCATKSLYSHRVSNINFVSPFELTALIMELFFKYSNVLLTIATMTNANTVQITLYSQLYQWSVRITRLRQFKHFIRGFSV